MSKNPMRIVTLLVLASLASSCAWHTVHQSRESVRIRREPYLLVPGDANGYRVTLPPSTKAILSIERTDEGSSSLEREYGPDEQCGFGYYYIECNIRPGEVERRLTVSLLSIQEGQQQSICDGESKDFVLNPPVSMNASFLGDHLELGKPFEFANFDSGTNGASTRLTIQFEAAPNRQSKEYPHFIDADVKSRWTVGDVMRAKDGGSFVFHVQAATNSFTIWLLHGEGDHHWAHAEKAEAVLSSRLTDAEAEMSLRKLYEARGPQDAQQPWFCWNHGRGRKSQDLDDLRDGKVVVDFPSGWIHHEVNDRHDGPSADNENRPQHP